MRVRTHTVWVAIVSVMLGSTGGIYLQVMQDLVRGLISWFNNVIISNAISHVPWVCMLILTHMKATGAEVSAPQLTLLGVAPPSL